MTDQNTPNNGGWHPAEPGAPTWPPPGQADLSSQPPGTVPGAPVPTAPADPWAPPPPFAPTPGEGAQPACYGAPVAPQWASPPPSGAGFPQPPTQPAWTQPPPGIAVTPPPAAGYNPVPAPGSPSYRGRNRRRRGVRGNGIYSIVAGVISLLVALISLAVGHFTFLVVLPVFGLIYGIVSISQGNRRVLGIIGTVLCALALILEVGLLAG